MKDTNNSISQRGPNNQWEQTMNQQHQWTTNLERTAAEVTGRVGRGGGA